MQARRGGFLAARRAQTASMEWSSMASLVRLQLQRKMMDWCARSKLLAVKCSSASSISLYSVCCVTTSRPVPSKLNCNSAEFCPSALPQLRSMPARLFGKSRNCRFSSFFVLRASKEEALRVLTMLRKMSSSELRQTLRESRCGSAFTSLPLTGCGFSQRTSSCTTTGWTSLVSLPVSLVQTMATVRGILA